MKIKFGIPFYATQRLLFIKSETQKKNSEAGPKCHPKGMHFHPVVLKRCVKLANRCGKGSYELIRNVLPTPCISTVYAY